MNKEAYSAASGVDLIYYLVDGSVPFGSGDEFVLNTLRQMHLPVYLILNKIDLLEKEQLIDLLLAWQRRMDFKEIIPISAKTQNNLDQLIEVTKNDLTDGVQYYPADQVCDYPEQFIMAEIIREKVLLLTEEEVPHSVAVVIERIRKNCEHLNHQRDDSGRTRFPKGHHHRQAGPDDQADRHAGAGRTAGAVGRTDFP